jgi:hypothetical protein
MSLNRIAKFSLLLVGGICLTLFVARAQTGNTGGSSGGTGGGQHGEGSGPAGSVPATGGAYFKGDPDRNPYASPTPSDITGATATPAGIPTHRHNKTSGHHRSTNNSAGKPAGSSPSPSPSR